ncbi:plastocyanin-like domain-containing [Paramyrothecium foliicola]|nr:plastocyanin-like domain-containing [Paramyrothecium foliicola]
MFKTCHSVEFITTTTIINSQAPTVPLTHSPPSTLPPPHPTNTINMQFFTTLMSLTLLAAAGVSAAPTKTSCDAPAPVKLTGNKRQVVAGHGGALLFQPDNIVAEVGDIIEFHFLPRNHSVVQSSFDKPCEPLAGGAGFNSGFNFATAEGQSENVFQIVVKDTKPIWFYCSQTVGNHCQKGMTGVINQNFDNQAFSLAKHRELAVNAGTSITPADVRGGNVIKNPEPLAGAKQ